MSNEKTAETVRSLRELLFQIALFNEHIRADSRAMVDLAQQVRGIEPERQERVAHDLLNHLSRVQGGSMSVGDRVRALGGLLTTLEKAQGWPGCCTACGGTGTDPSGPCWDCRGTGHTHEGKCRG